MQKHIRFLAGTALAFSLSSFAIAQETSEAASEEAVAEMTAETVIATVGETEIKLGHLIAAVSTLPEQYQSLDDQTLYDGILTQLVQQSILASTFNEALPPRVVYALENEKRSLVAFEVMGSITSQAVADADLQAIYDELYGSIDAEEEYNASHILVATQEEAAAIKAEIEEGADFARTAREKSTGPSGPNGGNLGWFGSGMMVPSFEAATIALSVGEVSDPVETQFGWHVIQLNETRQKDIPTLEDVRAELERDISIDAANAALDGATAETIVTPRDGDPIDPSLIRRQELLE